MAKKTTWITVREAAHALGVSESTVRARVRRGELPSRIEQRNGRPVRVVECHVSGRLLRTAKSAAHQVRRVAWFAAGAAAGGVIGNRADDLVSEAIRFAVHRGPAARDAPVWVASTLKYLAGANAVSNPRRAEQYLRTLLEFDGERDEIVSLLDEMRDLLQREIDSQPAVPPAWFGTDSLADVVAEICLDDQERALELVRSIPNIDIKSDLLAVLAKERAEDNAEVALGLARSIPVATSRRRAMSAVVNGLARTDLPGAIRLIDETDGKSIREVQSQLENLARRDPDQALELARSIPINDARLSALAAIAASIALTDLQRAAVVQAEVGPTGSYWMRSEFETFGASSPDEALKLAYSLVDEKMRSDAVTAVLEGISTADLRRALDLHNSAGIAPSWRVRQRLKVLAETDFEMALHLARSIADDEARGAAIESMAEQVSNSDLRRAIELLNETDRTWASWLESHLSALAADNPTEALAVARSIADNRIRSSALDDVASVWAAADLDRAIPLINEAASQCLPRSFSRRVCELGETDPVGAWRVADRINIVDCKSDLQRGIVAKFALNDPTAALQFATNISNGTDRSRAVATVSLATMAYDFDRALGIALTISTSEVRAETIHKLSRRVANRDIEQAAVLARLIPEECWRWRVMSAISIAEANPPFGRLLAEEFLTTAVHSGVKSIYQLMLIALDLQIPIEDDANRWTAEWVDRLVRRDREEPTGA